MLTPLVICFREGIEIFLVIIPLVVYFNRNNMPEMSKSVTLGGVLGGFVAALIGSIIFSQAALLEGAAGQVFDGGLGVVLSALILYSIVLLRKNNAFTTAPDKRYISLSKKGLFIISAITFFRELLEAVLFILTSSGGSPFIVAASALLGLLLAALLVYVVAKGVSRLNISLVFYLLNLFLIGLGAFYFGDALEVLVGNIIPQIFTIGILVYAVPSYFIVIKNDLKKLLNSGKIK